MRRGIPWVVGLVALGLVVGEAATAQAAILGFDNGVGFTTSSNGTGDPTIRDGVLTLTDNRVSEARSVFYNTPQPITSFVAQFVYQATGGAPLLADGFAFVLQNDPRGPGALGGDGNQLGYGERPPFPAISPSAAIQFNLFGSRGTALNTDGAIDGVNGGYITTSPVDFGNGHPIQITLTYDGTTLKENLRDPSTNVDKFTHSYQVNLANILGSSTAFVGFTGATGASISTQTLSNFSFVPEPASIVMGSMGFLGVLGGYAWRRRRQTLA